MSRRTLALAALLAGLAAAPISHGDATSAAADGTRASTPAIGQTGGTGKTGVPRASAPAAFEAAVAVSADPAQGRVGDRIHVLAHASSPPGASVVRAPELAVDGKLGVFRVLTIEAAGADLLLTLTPEETGDLEIPPFDVEVQAASGATTRARGASCRVKIGSVLGDGQGTMLADLKPPAEFPVPWPWKEILLGAAAAALVTAAVAWIVRRLRRPRAPGSEPERELAPGVTPDAWAREELARLLGRRLLEEGRYREFHIELADLARRYVEMRFRIPALERTTEEVRDEMMRALVGGESTELTLQVLACCDRVKFAKYVPSSRDTEEAIGRLRELIDRTPTVPAQAAPVLAAAEGAA